jgi:hypothetical protein
MPLRLAAAALVALLAVTPALADAVIYKGTLGKAAIVLELSQPIETAKGKVVGRYFYNAKGIDIPLDAVKAGGGKVDLAEEKPCTPSLCPLDDNGTPTGPAPIAAKWHLEANAEGKLGGSWSSGGKTLPIALERDATRTLSDDFDNTPQGLEDIVLDLSSGQAPIGLETSPYELIKVSEGPVEPGDPVKLGVATYQMITDPRTKFAFPHVSDLGGADLSAVDRYLERRHWRMSLDALACEAQAYQGFGWNDLVANSIGTLGGYPDEQVTVNYLSPTVMSWEESGSLFCAGAHPDNHDENYSLDVRSGEKLDLSRIFKGWVPTPIDEDSPKDLKSARAKPGDYTWGPDEKLAAYVRAHLPKTDADTGEDDCSMGELIASNLNISFVQGDKARFSLDGLPYAIQSCGGTLFETPLKNLRPFLTPGAAAYFPSLAGK